jgi:hypothetical protein
VRGHLAGSHPDDREPIRGTIVKDVSDTWRRRTLSLETAAHGETEFRVAFQDRIDLSHKGSFARHHQRRDVPQVESVTNAVYAAMSSCQGFAIQ